MTITLEGLPLAASRDEAAAKRDKRFLPPRWSFIALFVGFPAWWALGLGSFIWLILAAPMLAALVVKPRVKVPKGFLLFIMFFAWMMVSVVTIDSGERAFGWALRVGWYLAAAIVMLFIINAPSDLPMSRVIRTLTIFWMIVVGGGYLGLFLPNLHFTAPASYLMPGALKQNDWINSLVTPGVADIHSFLGFAVPRPKAPFPFTNGWGSAFALLFPFSLAATSDRDVGLSPRLIRIAQGLSVVPVVMSLNRGLWLSLGLGMAYAAVRFMASGQAKALIGVVVAFVVVVGLVMFTPLGDLVSSRVDNGHSDEGRQELYIEAIDRTFESPFLGYGAPRPSLVNPRGPSVGTHGQIWLVLFSHGFVGAGLWLAFYATVIWNTRSPSSLLGFWAHVSFVIGGIQMSFYGQLPHQMVVMFAAAGVAFAETRKTRTLVESRIEMRPPFLAVASRSTDVPRSELFSMPALPEDMSARVQAAAEGRIAASALPALGAGAGNNTAATLAASDPLPDPSDELAWLSRLLFSSASEVRIAPPTDKRDGEMLRGQLMVSPSRDEPQLLTTTDRRGSAAAVRRYSDATSLRQRCKITAASVAMLSGAGQRLNRERLALFGPEGLGRLTGADSLVVRIQEMIDEDDVTMAVTMGPPRANRKPVLQLMNSGGEIVAFAKVGWSPLTRLLVRNEASWLSYLSRIELAGILVPRFVDQIEWNGLDVAVSAAVPIRSYRIRRPSKPPALQVIRQIATSSGTTDELVGDSRFGDHHLEESQGSPHESLVRRALERHGDELLEFGAWHGDFSPWNMSSGLRGVSVFDWEFAALGVPVGFDVLHFHLQVNQILRGLPAAEALDRSFVASKPMLERLGVSGPIREATESCYLIELAARTRRFITDDGPERLVQLDRAVTQRLENPR